MRYGGLKILSEKRQKGKNCIKTFQNTPHIVHMGHTTEKKNVLLMIILLPCQA